MVLSTLSELALPHGPFGFYARSSMQALLVVCAAAAAALCLAAAAGAYDFVQVATGFDQPVYVTTAPNDPATLYVVERAGDIRIVRDGQLVGTFLDIRSQVWSGGEGGLLSVAFHPKYAQNHLFYVDYTDLAHRTHVTEYSSANGVAVPASARDLLVVAQKYPNHKGGDLQFDRRGRLYVGMGDGGSNDDSLVNDPDNRGQDLKSRLGKLLQHQSAGLVALAHRRLRAAQSLALLVRSRDRRPLARRCRRRHLRRARLPPRQETRPARQLRLESLRGARGLQPEGEAARQGSRRRARALLRSQLRRLLDRRRLRLPRQPGRAQHAGDTSSETSAAASSGRSRPERSTARARSSSSSRARSRTSSPSAREQTASSTRSASTETFTPFASAEGRWRHAGRAASRAPRAAPRGADCRAAGSAG